MILGMSEPDNEPPGLAELLMALRDQLRMLTDLNGRLVDAQRESSGILREFSAVVREAFAESVKVQAEVGENILRSNAALAQTLDEIAQKLGVPPSALPSDLPPRKRGGGSIQ